MDDSSTGGSTVLGLDSSMPSPFALCECVENLLQSEVFEMTHSGFLEPVLLGEVLAPSLDVVRESFTTVSVEQGLNVEVARIHEIQGGAQHFVRGAEQQGEAEVGSPRAPFRQLRAFGSLAAAPPQSPCAASSVKSRWTGEG
ncbi:hypothetical protein ABZS86_20400 [Streptomyces sp. NPDC005355]|uniref:hypothetical protein n=1 Tax=Streptomyces sp. NPDC005355 TaxID=3157038 RepID=UPI0033A9017E